MPVATLHPGQNFNSNQAHGELHVYGQSGGPGHYAISLVPNGATQHDIAQGQTDTYTVGANQMVIIDNNGNMQHPQLNGVIQVLYK